MTNDSARGYIVLVLKNLGYKEEDIDKILADLKYIYVRDNGGISNERV